MPRFSETHVDGEPNVLKTTVSKYERRRSFPTSTPTWLLPDNQQYDYENEGKVFDFVAEESDVDDSDSPSAESASATTTAAAAATIAATAASLSAFNLAAASSSSAPTLSSLSPTVSAATASESPSQPTNYVMQNNSIRRNNKRKQPQDMWSPTAVEQRPQEQGSHKCPTCDDSFSRKENLKRHMITHTRNDPHKCNECSAQYTRLDNLREHVKLKHPAEHDNDDGISKRTCNACGQLFASPSGLNRGKCCQSRIELTLKKTPDSLTCACGKTFQRNCRLQVHIAKCIKKKKMISLV